MPTSVVRVQDSDIGCPSTNSTTQATPDLIEMATAQAHLCLQHAPLQPPGSAPCCPRTGGRPPSSADASYPASRWCSRTVCPHHSAPCIPGRSLKLPALLPMLSHWPCNTEKLLHQNLSPWQLQSSEHSSTALTCPAGTLQDKSCSHPCRPRGFIGAERGRGALVGPDGQAGVGVHALLHAPQAGHALRQPRLYDLPCIAAPFRHCWQHQNMDPLCCHYQARRYSASRCQLCVSDGNAEPGISLCRRPRCFRSPV